MNIKSLPAKHILHTKTKDGVHTEHCLGCHYEVAFAQLHTLWEDVNFYKHEWENACARAIGNVEEVSRLRELLAQKEIDKIEKRMAK